MENIPNQIMGRVQTIFGVYTRLMVVLSALLAGWIIEIHNIIYAVNFTALHYLFSLIGTIIVMYRWKKPYNILSDKLL